MFHLKDGLYFDKSNDIITISWGNNTIEITKEMLASVMASMSERNETTETYYEALDFLKKEKEIAN